MTAKLQDTLVYARGLRADRAAAYIGMGKTKFLELVEKGKIPRAVLIEGVKVWDRLELDAAFEAYKDAQAHEPEKRPNSFDKILELTDDRN